MTLLLIFLYKKKIYWVRLIRLKFFIEGYHNIMIIMFSVVHSRMVDAVVTDASVHILLLVLEVNTELTTYFVSIIV